jgi:hypothetical protein
MFLSLMKGSSVSGFNARNYFELIRPIYYFLLVTVFMSLISKVEEKQPINGSKYNVNTILKFYLLAQVVLAAFQKLQPTSFLNKIIGVFYSTDKVSEGVGRVVGLSGNPNTLAVCISLVALYFLSRALYKKDNFQAGVIAFFHLFAVILTTSRFVLLVLLVIYFIVFIFRLSLFSRICIALVLFVSFVNIYNIVMDNPYYNQLFTHLMNFDLYKIRSFSLRLEHYELLINAVKGSPLLSYGPNKELSNVGDNIFIFIFFQWGIIGAILQLLPLVILLGMTFIDKSQRAMHVFMCTCLLFACGLVYETFYNMIYMPIYLYFVSDYLFFRKKDRNEDITYRQKHTE